MADGDGTSALDVLERFQELENQVIVLQVAYGSLRVTLVLSPLPLPLPPT